MSGKFPVADEQYRTIDRRMGEIKRRLELSAGSPLDPELVADDLQDIIDGGWSRRLINGMFLPAEYQLMLVEKQNRRCKWDFIDRDFEQLGPPPAWSMDSKLAVVILDISLADVATTFDTAWNLAKAIQPNESRWNQFLSDSNHLRLLTGKTHQRGLRWQIVDLGANVNYNSIDVRSVATSPVSAILWMAFYSPKWIQAMDGTTVPYVWLPGYEVSIPDRGTFTDVPVLRWNRDLREIKLSANDAGIYHGGWRAVPVLRESPK